MSVCAVDWERPCDRVAVAGPTSPDASRALRSRESFYADRFRSVIASGSLASVRKVWTLLATHIDRDILLQSRDCIRFQTHVTVSEAGRVVEFLRARQREGFWSSLDPRIVASLASITTERFLECHV